MKGDMHDLDGLSYVMHCFSTHLDRMLTSFTKWLQPGTLTLVVSAASKDAPIQRAAMVVLEANLSEASLRAVSSAATSARVPIFLEPVSVPKSARCVNLHVLLIVIWACLGLSGPVCV